jgi:APA family basic amino acid/polyamine antiporter
MVEGRLISTSRDKELGLWTSTALVVGNMIGSGIFLLPASLAVYGGISIFGWLLTSVGALLLALMFSRLSRMVPHAGGPYIYTRRAFGDFAGFIVAWGYWISILSGNAAIAVALVGYLGVFWPAISGSPVLAGMMALLNVWVLTWVNARGVRNAGILQLLTTCLKLSPLIVIATLGLWYFRADHLQPFNMSGESGFSAVTATAALTLWAFMGLESATIPSDRVKDPQWTIPRATILGTLLSTFVYVLGTIAVMGIIHPAELARSTAPFADAASRIWGVWAGYAVAAGAVVSCFGALNGWILLQGQVPLAMARDKLFPVTFGRLSSRNTPVAGLVISSVLVTLLIAMNYSKNLVELFTFIILLSTLTALLPYVFSALAQFVLQRQQPMDKPTLLRSSIIALLALLYSLWAVYGVGPEALFWGLVLILAGIPVYIWLRRQPS